MEPDENQALDEYLLYIEMKKASLGVLADKSDIKYIYNGSSGKSVIYLWYTAVDMQVQVPL